MLPAAVISSSYCFMRAASTWTVGGARAGAATNSYRCSILAFASRNNNKKIKDKLSETYELGVANELAGEPEEGLLEVVVGLGRDIVVLEVLLAVEGDGLGLDLALLNIDLVTAENDGDVLADTDEITVPVGNVLVGDTGGNIEHDDTALAVDVVTVTETTELLLTGGIPDIELDLTEVLHCVLVNCASPILRPLGGGGEGFLR